MNFVGIHRAFELLHVNIAPRLCPRFSPHRKAFENMCSFSLWLQRKYNAAANILNTHTRIPNGKGVLLFFFFFVINNKYRKHH